eukprot:1190406-Prorocentrum_minimum.AAC.1
MQEGVNDWVGTTGRIPTSLTMRGLLPPTPSGTPPGGASRRSACPIAWRGRATSRKIPTGGKELRKGCSGNGASHDLVGCRWQVMTYNVRNWDDGADWEQRKSLLAQ